ncbi:gp218 [Bacillus phage G]|uniref:Gp218 n=1 Tax=Bacillus phage G TaxID=2884420 RepID=G3M9V9_9CAUD|nr:gp218 [Bacillus phage G]AEO93477.1 gp218 [Bacillus phage G]
MEKTIEDFGLLIREGFGGSIGYGTNHAKSDVDLRGLFIPKRHFLLGINNVDQFNCKTVKDTKYGKSDDIEYFSLQKFINLALEGNPNVVEQLFINREHVTFENEFGKELYELRYEFLTKNAYGRFGGYAHAQMKRMDSKGNHNGHSSHRDIIEEFGYDTKHAMHLVRLYQMGIQILRDGELYTYRPNRQELLDIRYGKYTLSQIKNYAEELNKELEDAMMKSKIPDYPDFDKINRWVIDVTDRAHGLNTKKGVFKGVTFNVLPLEYEMVDKCSILTVANRLLRKKDKAQAVGVAVPYKDWFTGLRKFEEFKFEKTRIDNIHKVINKVRSCDPKLVDMLYASEKHIIFEHPMAKEFKDKMKTMLSTKYAYNKAYSYVTGNLKAMQNWENLKDRWEKERATTNKKMTDYPPVPKKTLSENAARMTKYGYDTLSAFDIVHVLKLFIELMNTGTIVDSRAYEPELYAIKQGHYKTFEEFNDYVQELLAELEKAKDNSVLTNHNFNEIEDWLIDFIDRFHQQLD